jgi:threonine/homoserine/homoserine lactone efflux protein
MRYLISMLASIALFMGILLLVLILTVPEMIPVDYKILSILGGFFLFFLGVVYMRRPTPLPQRD